MKTIEKKMCGLLMNQANDLALAGSLNRIVDEVHFSMPSNSENQAWLSYGCDDYCDCPYDDFQDD